MKQEHESCTQLHGASQKRTQKLQISYFLSYFNREATKKAENQKQIRRKYEGKLD